MSGKIKHGHASSRSNGGESATYAAWAAMKARCRNRNHPAYRYYGARGISYCDAWESFEAFLRDMGERPASHLSLDRIDNDGNYEPSNCRWATRSQQTANKRPGSRLTAEKVQQLLALRGKKLMREIAKDFGISVNHLRSIYCGDVVAWQHLTSPPTPEARHKLAFPRSKLTPDDVRKIRASSQRNAVLGREFGVSRSLISMVKNFKLWREVV